MPGKSHGRRSLVGYSLWGRKESDTTERLHFHSFFLSFFPVLNQRPDRENQRCCSPPGWPLSNFPPTPSAIRTLGIVAFPFFLQSSRLPLFTFKSLPGHRRLWLIPQLQHAVRSLSGLCLLLLICPTYSVYQNSLSHVDIVLDMVSNWQ